jgi:hypothetical protein
MMRVRLHDIAFARAGDKGNTSNISVWAYDPAHYPAIKAQITPERLKAAYPELFRGRITRYALDTLCGLNFVIEDGLEGGVNASLNLDAHGKSFSFLVLALEIDLP